MKTLSIPAHDRLAFDSLPEKARAHIEACIPRVNELWARVASVGITVAALQCEQAWGVSYSTLVRWHYGCTRHGWRGLLKANLLNKGVLTLHPEFREWWFGLVLENQRNSAKAHERFAAMYFRGEPIPGLPPAAERTPFLPRGLSKGSLCKRRNLPKKAALTLARQGFAAARAHLTTGPQDVSHIRPLEYILFDDVELDFLVTVPESQRPVKIRLIVAMDLCSRVILGYVVRPAIVREDGVETGLKLRDMKACVAWLLRKWGCPLDYAMHFVCERGTAHLPDAAKIALAEMTEGRVIVHDTSMVVGQVFEWRDRATGNSWGKAWLESFFNSLHNELQHLPGQKGRRYDLAPAELHGRKEALALIEKMGQRLTLADRMRLRRPFLGLRDALAELDDALARLHNRTDHKLLCFDQVGIWRSTPDDAWKPEWDFPEHLAEVSHKMLWDVRQEKPIERFMRRLPEAERRFIVGDSSLQRLMEEQRRVPFRGMGFSFEFQRTDYTYLPPETLLPHLHEGEHYLLWFHPQEMGEIYVTRDAPHYGYLGMLRRFTAGRRGELADAQEYLRTQKARMGRVAAEVAQSKLPRLRAAADAIAENAAIGEEALRSYEIETTTVEPVNAGELAPVTATIAGMENDRAALRQQRIDEATAERVQVARIRREHGSLDDLLPEPTPTFADEPDDAADAMDQLL